MFTDNSKAVLFLWIFLLFMFRVCRAVLSLHFSLVVTCCERAILLAALYALFSCVFVTFPCGVLGQVWYLVVSISDLCLLPYLENKVKFPKRYQCFAVKSGDSLWRKCAFW